MLSGWNKKNEATEANDINEHVEFMSIKSVPRYH
jgi:hypothetical protein